MDISFLQLPSHLHNLYSIWLHGFEHPVMFLNSASSTETKDSNSKRYLRDSSCLQGVKIALLGSFIQKGLHPTLVVICFKIQDAKL